MNRLVDWGPSNLNRWCLAIIIALFTTICPAEENIPWPDVLTLEFALSQASLDHPDLQVANAQQELARAQLLDAESRYGFESHVEGRLRWVDPPDIAYDQSQGDHRLSLFLNKVLYDFGRTAAYQQAGTAAVAGQAHFFQDSLNQHRIAIMAAYFNVLLADVANAREEEAMSIAFIRADRAADRNELGQVSDIDLLEARSNYQQVREARYRSRALQRITRSRLANVLNRPGQLPADLVTPELAGNDRPIPGDVTEWIDKAQSANPQLKGLRAQVLAAQQNLEAAQAYDNPVLIGEVEVSEYARESGSYDNWRAGVTINIPLTTGGRANAERAKRRAELVTAQARLEQQRREVEQELLEQWSELQTLKVSLDRARALIDFRNLYLDRSRTLYQLEVQSDLGDAMTKTTEARLENMRVEFAIALAWARIDALLGREIYMDGKGEAGISEEKSS